MKKYPELRTSEKIDLKELYKKDSKDFDPFYD